MSGQAPFEGAKLIYDQAFFLELARRGKEDWNRWRAQNPRVDGQPYISANFERVDFRDPANAAIDFSGFIFGDEVNFRASVFGGNRFLDHEQFHAGMAKFVGAKFGHKVNFSAANFGDSANFACATFGVVVDLSGVIFGGSACLVDARFDGAVNLSGATFGDSANLSRTNFGADADLTQVNFGIDANLRGVTFESGSDLSEIKFGDRPVFACATFGTGIYLLDSIFGFNADFSVATFERYVVLSGATFGTSTKFTGATFGDRVDFSGARFGHNTTFTGAIFGVAADFSGARFRGAVNFDACSETEWDELLSNYLPFLASWSEDRRQKYLQVPEDLSEAKPDSFLDVKFDAAQFYETADFSRRRLIGRLDFTRARFGEPPVFNGCEGAQNIGLYGTKIRFRGSITLRIRKGRSLVTWPIPVQGWTTSSETALRLRALRKLAEDNKNHDLERDLYIEERKAERGIFWQQYRREGWRGILRLVSHAFSIIVTLGYALLADYGRSFTRPLAGLVISVFVFHWAYASLLIVPTDPGRLNEFHRAAWAFAISNAVPFLSALTLERDVKLTLLCGDQPIDASAAQQRSAPQCIPVPSGRFQLLVLVQSTFSALCVFFVALALRNYYRLK